MSAQNIFPFENKRPVVAADAFIHPHACVIGDVTIGQRASIWPSVVLRGDMGTIVVGDESSIQDGTIVHLTEGLSSTCVGKRVTVGHRVILHGCIVEDDCLIGMGAIILDNAVVGTGSLIGAGALVTAGARIPPNSVVMGSPHKIIRTTTEKDRAMIRNGHATYVSYAARYMRT